MLLRMVVPILLVLAARAVAADPDPVVESIRAREGTAPLVSLQHALNRAIADPAGGEALLLGRDEPPARALAAWMAFARGDTETARRRIAEAEESVERQWAAGLERAASLKLSAEKAVKSARLLAGWARALDLAAAPSLLRRTMRVFRLHDGARKILNIKRYSDWDQDVGELWDNNPPGQYRFPDPRLHALKFPCIVFRNAPEDAIAAFPDRPYSDIAGIVALPFDCPLRGLASFAEGRELLAARTSSGSIRDRNFAGLSSGTRLMMIMAADARPGMALAILDGDPVAVREPIPPEEAIPAPEVCDRARAALVARYVGKEGLSPANADRLASAYMRELIPSFCEVRRRIAYSPRPPRNEEERFEAIFSRIMVDPVGTEAQLRTMDSRSAKAALALLLHEFHAPSPERNAEIQSLVDTLTYSEQAKKRGQNHYNGSARSLHHWIVNDLPTRMPCALLLHDPDLLEFSEPIHGGSRDGRLPFPDCDLGRDYPIPSSVDAYWRAASGPTSGYYNTAGTIRSTRWRAEQINQLRMHMFPRSFLPPGRHFYDDPRQDAKSWSPPFLGWSYLTRGNRRIYEDIAAKYRQALFDLSAHYRVAFGLSALEADVAAGAALRALTIDREQTSAGWLHQAILGGDSLDEIARRLATVEDVNDVDFTADAAYEFTGPPDPILHVAVGRPDVIRLLLSKKADPRAVNPFGKTAVMAAAQEDDLESLRLLLAAGAPLHAVTDAGGLQGKFVFGYMNLHHDGRSALHYAAANAGLAVIRFLIAAGADPQQPDILGYRPIQYLVGDGPVGVNPRLDDADMREAMRLLR